ncbi:MAG: PTS fructose transporter subunit IIA [Gammaproteobacteria bacterium]|nr:MAG: PTS fructose transporter subunit IIA [Gammaproteobacteria bacterium]
MIGLLILAQSDLGKGMIEAVEHTFGRRPPQLEVLGVDYSQTPEQIENTIEQYLSKVNLGDGVLILADIYGATHTNVACRRLQRGHIELITGVNLPMLLRVLNYRNLGMDDLIDKALSGGCGGIVCAASSPDIKEAGR